MLSAFVLAFTLSGVVHDPLGAVVPGATVVARPAAGAEQRAVTGPQGTFTLTVPAGDLVLVVRAGGFAERAQELRLDGDRRDLVIVLAPATVLQNVTVTATRSEQRLGTVPASVNVLDADEIRQSPAVVADDVLRQIPTFSLFRRTSSLSSHPTAQGVSLRGVGPSGVSRTLVLLDGVPFNDPFGGWVYWTRVPLESVDRIEVVDGSSSSLYGNDAMGGVINIITAPPSRRTLELKPQYGNRHSPKVDFLGSDVFGTLGVVVDGSTFSTDGFPIVAASERGRVDNKASVDFHTVNARLDYNPTDRVGAFFRAGYFRERRNNGKASTIDGVEEANDTTWSSASGGTRILLPDQSTLEARLFTDFEQFHSNFLAVPAASPPRSVGRMTLNQSVPTTGVGAMAQWSKAFGAVQLFSAGADWRRVDGDSNEEGLDTATGTVVTLRRVSGGTQQSAGAFVQDLLTPTSRLTLTFSARVDRWRNYDAHNLETIVATGKPTANSDPALPGRTDTVVSPRAAALYRISDRVSAWGDLGTGFRAPTLNELYRQFRVGTVLTLANNQLGAERLVGGEAGINIEPIRRLTWRTTWFENRLRNAVSNVTLTTTPSTVTQQRQNLGRTRVWGVQTDVEYHLGASWKVSAGYLYDRATVEAFASSPSLVGKDLPQVPRNRGSIRVAYANPRFATVAVDVQAIGSQFDDDRNSRSIPSAALAEAGLSSSTPPGLPKYVVVDLSVSRALGRNLDVFAGAQNLFNAEYFVGTLPTTIGSPRLVNVGVRARIGSR